MPYVLTTASKTTCAHSGTVVTAGVDKLRVNRTPVLVEEGISGKDVSACSTVPKKDNNGKDVDVTCTKVDSVVPGAATKLQAGGKPVMLDTVSGTTNGMVATVTPQPGLTAKAGHTLLSAK